MCHTPLFRRSSGARESIISYSGLLTGPGSRVRARRRRGTRQTACAQEGEIQSPCRFLRFGAEVDAPVSHIPKTDESSVSTHSPSGVLAPSGRRVELRTPTIPPPLQWHDVERSDRTVPARWAFDEKGERQHFKLLVGKSAKTLVFSHFRLYILQLQSPFPTCFNWRLAIT